MHGDPPPQPATDRWLEPAARTLARCDALATHSEAAGRIVRRAFTPAMTAAHAALRSWMESAGMAVRLDPMGNLRGRLPAPDGGALTLYIGSHLDTVVDAGRYDGILGVLAGVALAEELADAELPYALEVIAFCDEEGVRFGGTYFGSQALAGRFDPAMLELVDADGVTLAEALHDFGGDPERIPEAALEPTRTLAYLELHIEQGPRLEAAGAAIGAAEAIVGQSKLELVLRGRAAHAGTTPMTRRSDALAGAADVILATEAMARAEADAVATVGRIEVRPNASNVIPAEALLTLDVRHRNDEVREQLVYNLLEASQVAARARGLELLSRTLLAEPTRPLDPRLTATLVQRAGALPMVSGAGHDAAVLAPVVPTALLFVRSPGGVSHHPDEAVRAPDVARALEALAGVALELAAEVPGGREVLDLAIRGARVATPHGVREVEIGIDGGTIAELSGRVGAARAEIDAGGLLALPAVVDSHVHFNEPGRSDWEGFAHGSAALAVGGGAVFVDMPLNSEPPLLTAADFDAKRAAAAAASIADFALWGGLTPANVERLPELAAAGVVGVKAFLCDSGIASFAATDDGTLWRGMELAAELGLVVAVHAENDAITRAETARAAARQRRGELTAAQAFVRGRPLVAELEAVERTLLLAEESGCRVHLVHLSSARSAALVARARGRGVDASCETCPHYLTFDETDLERIGAPLKCAPPLRGADERTALWAALTRGDIDLIGSDHSPAPPAMKGADLATAWGGVAGVQSTLAVLLDGAAAGRLDAPRIAELTAAAPARRLRLAGKGVLAAGADADIALVDPGERWTLAAAALRQRWPISPYLGRAFSGRVRRTLRRGETIALDGEVPPGTGRGQLLRPAPR